VGEDKSYSPSQHPSNQFIGVGCRDIPFWLPLSFKLALQTLFRLFTIFVFHFDIMILINGVDTYKENIYQRNVCDHFEQWCPQRSLGAPGPIPVVE
jgi:hypothetical protein